MITREYYEWLRDRKWETKMNDDQERHMEYDTYTPPIRFNAEDFEYEPGDPLVNSPDHYTQNGHEVIDVIQAKFGDTDLDPFVGYCLGNVSKYLLRCPHKGKLLQDLEKAQWYLNRAIETLKNDNSNR